MRQTIDQAELGRKIDEGAGRLQDSMLVAKPDQRLDAPDLLGANVDLGLKGAAELPILDREPKRLLVPHPLSRLVLHAAVEDGERALGPAFRAVHRDVRVLAQCLIGSTVLGKAADADRRRRKHL